MPEKQSHTQQRQIRIPDDDWRDFAKAAKDEGTDRSALVREFIRWYLRHPGAKLPQRPSRGEPQVPA